MAFAQVVQVRHAQVGQAYIARVAVCVVGAFEEVNDGRSTDINVCPIHLHEQLNVAGGVLARKGRSRGSVALDQRYLREPILG